MTALQDAVAAYLARCSRQGACLVGPGKSYGVVRVGSRQISAHRASYYAHKGPIPAGLVIRHTCDNPPCVEPSHLLVGTYKQNEADKIARGRSLKGLAVANATVPPEVIRESVATYLAGGVSQGEMALRVGVGQSTFGRWVRAEARQDSTLVGASVGKGSRIATPLQPCGTRGGYGRHRSRSETPCPPCSAANAEYSAAYRRRPMTPPATPSDVSPVAGGSQGRPVSPAWPADPSP